MQKQASSGKHKIGLQFLGQNFMQAYEVYQNMAEKYFQLAKENKPALTAARKCYIIAAENAMAIQALFNDDSNETKKLMKQKVQDNLKFAEMCHKKIEENPEFDPKKVYKSQFSDREQIIIDHSATVRGKNIDLWTPNSGIVK